MSKTKLEVIRINEDVIATSTSITINGAPTGECYLFKDINSDGNFNVGDYVMHYNNGSEQSSFYIESGMSSWVNQYYEWIENAGGTFEFEVYYRFYVVDEPWTGYLYRCSDVGHSTHINNSN